MAVPAAISGTAMVPYLGFPFYMAVPTAISGSAMVP